MAWTNPRTWTPGELVTALMMNQHVRDNLNYLKTTVDGSYPRQSFRGLSMRTGLTQAGGVGDWTKKVLLVNVDEVVMSDGWRYANVGNLVADITAAGAGGLDTGAAATLSWYELHLIAKSSDDTKALMFHRAKRWLEDETQSVDDNFFAINGGATPAAQQKLAQGFQVDVNGTLPFVDVKLERIGTVGGFVWFTIEADVSGSPSGVPLATSNVTGVTNLPVSSALWHRFMFPSPATVATGTTYHLVAQVSTAGNATDYMRWRVTTTAPYARGALKLFNGTTWSASASDTCFKIYTTQFDLALTMPTGYDRSCKLGYVFRDASQLVPFIAREHRVQMIPYSTDRSLGSFANAGPLLIDCSQHLPPSPVRLWAAMASSIDANATGVAPVPEGNQGILAANTWGLAGAQWGYAPVGSVLVATIFPPPIMTDCQGIYAYATQTGQIWLNDWEWFS
jgi:hypothetical protein